MNMTLHFSAWIYKKDDEQYGQKMDKFKLQIKDTEKIEDELY